MATPPTVISQSFDAEIPISKLREHPDNPRRGRDDAVGASIEATGFFGAVIVHKRTRRVLAGNTRYRTMKAKGATTIPGFWVTCDDATAKRIMLADNRTSDLAAYDDDLLALLLQDVQAAATTTRRLQPCSLRATTGRAWPSSRR
jgi:site-specific DNA-methyltransferase (adenine-specific)